MPPDAGPRGRSGAGAGRAAFSAADEAGLALLHEGRGRLLVIGSCRALDVVARLHIEALGERATPGRKREVLLDLAERHRWALGERYGERDRGLQDMAGFRKLGDEPDVLGVLAGEDRRQQVELSRLGG